MNAPGLDKYRCDDSHHRKDHECDISTKEGGVPRNKQGVAVTVKEIVGLRRHCNYFIVLPCHHWLTFSYSGLTYEGQHPANVTWTKDKLVDVVL